MLLAVQPHLGQQAPEISSELFSRKVFETGLWTFVLRVKTGVICAELVAVFLK